MDGILIVDKPAGITSHDVVSKVRKLYRTRRVGHTGTLDPFATGVLVLCLDRATRLVQFLTSEEKEYVATMRLGVATDTGDRTGTPLGPAVDARGLAEAEIEAALAPFRGRIRQIPPMYSAKKVGGVKLYEMARQGQEVERAPIDVEIRALELCAPLEPVAPGQPGTRDVSFRVVCTSGTYVRTLAEDIGRALGVGAHLAALRRTRAGHCDLAGASRLDDLAALPEGEPRQARLLSMTDALSMPSILLTPQECNFILHGRSIPRRGEWATGARAQLLAPSGQLMAIAAFDAEKSLWQPKVVLADPAAEPRSDASSARIV